MRKIIITILLSVTAALSACLILNGCKGKKKDEALSLKMINNYIITDKDRRINQVLYFTRDNIFNNYDIVDSVSLIDEEDETVLKLKINNIKKTNYIHKYKDTKYNSYIYDLSIPAMNNDLYFKNAKLEIVSEDKTLLLPIGIVSIKYDDNTNKTLSVNNLEGKCNYNPYQTLSKVDINLENKTNNNIVIKKMNMGEMVDFVTIDSSDVIFNSNKTNIDAQIIGYMQKELSLNLSYKSKYLLKESYIEIIYNDGISDKTTYIDTFNYYDNGYKLPELDELITLTTFKI